MNIVEKFQKTINQFFENIEEYKQSQKYRSFLFRITIQRSSSFSEHSSSDRNTSTTSIKQFSNEVNTSKTLRFREKYDSNRFLTRIQHQTNTTRRRLTLDNLSIFNFSSFIEKKNNFIFNSRSKEFISIEIVKLILLISLTKR